MTTLLLVLAGGLGAGVRVVVDGELRRRGPDTLPWATVAVNVTGSLLLGVVVGLVHAGAAPEGLRLVLGVGFCGGYTTFGTAGVEVARLALAGRVRAALGVGLGQLGLALLAAAVGLGLGSLAGAG